MGSLFRPSAAVTLVAAGAALLAPLAPAAASGRPVKGSGASLTAHVLSTDVVAPVQLAVHGGAVYVGDAARSRLVELGRPGPVARGPQPGEIAGVDFVSADHAVAYTALDRRTGKGTVTIQRQGHPTVVADVSGFEKRHNPDGGLFYGAHTADPCVREALVKLPLPTARPVGYHGKAESHPYAVAADGHGGWYVVDSSANDVLRVDRAGKVSLVAVLPAQPHTFTRADARALGLPTCVVGIRYAFESVPTDVAVGTDGALYITTFPGGPVDPRLGARGSVYRVDPSSGAGKQMATGFAGAVSLSIADNGRIFVAELFSGQISVVTREGDRHVVKPVIKLPNVVAVAYDDGALYASTLAPGYLQGKPTGHGSIVRIG